MKISSFRLVVLIAICTISFESFSQNNSNFKFRSISTEFGYFTSLSDSDFFGIEIGGTVDFLWDDVIFGLQVHYGIGTGVVIFNEENYTEVNVLIGREWSLSNTFSFEGYIGIGYFDYYYEEWYSDYSMHEGNIGFPIIPKLKMYFSDHWSLALAPTFNVNTYWSVIFSGCLSLQYRFN